MLNIAKNHPIIFPPEENKKIFFIRERLWYNILYIEV